MKKITTNFFTFILASALCTTAIGKEINLKIEIQGQGKVSVVGSEKSCNESCNLTIERKQNQPILLIKSPIKGVSLNNGLVAAVMVAMVSYQSNYIATTQRSAKTLILDDFNSDKIYDAAIMLKNFLSYK